MNRVASGAIVEDGVVMGEGNTIHEYAIIRSGTVLGDRNQIGAFAKIGPRTRLGDDNYIDAHVCLGGNPQVAGAREVESGLHIGSRNTFREFCTVNRSKEPGAATLIGDDNYFMSYAHAAHDVKVGDHCVFASYAGLSGHVEVMDHAVLGGMAGVHQFCRIGYGAMVSGLAKITKDLPPFGLAEGRPAVLVGLNVLGLKRLGFSPEERAAVKAIHHEFYRCGLPFGKAAARLLEVFPDQRRALEFVEFFKASSRGVMRYGRPKTGPAQSG